MTPSAEVVGALNRIYALLTDQSEAAYFQGLEQEAQAFLEAVECRGAPVIVDWAKQLLSLIEQGLGTVTALEQTLLAAQAMVSAWLETPEDGRPGEIHSGAVDALASLGDKLDAVREHGSQLIVYRARIQADLSGQV